MTEDSAKKKLTLSGKSTLTLKLGNSSRPQSADGKKMVQVEVRKKRIVGQKVGTTENKPKIEIDHKIGRNDPCPCGSGKKYKKCCGCLTNV